jgi:hypothetical protein
MLGVGRPKADGTAAIDFLKQLYPKGAWVLTAIQPEGPTVTRLFNNLEDARRFVVEHNEAGYNIYYSVNVTKGDLRSKAKKSDITFIEALHLDADPAPDESPEEFKARILPKLESFDPRPSVVIDSGNGVQGLWFLKKRVKNDGSETIAQIEDLNHALAEAFDADPSTRNIDRILRLPGTINYPNARKRKIGRKECSAKLLWFEDIAYPLSEFPSRRRRLEAMRPATDAETTSDIPPKLETLLHVEGPGPYKSRSELLFAFVCGAVQRKVDPGVIVRACLDPAHAGRGIFEHCAENGGEGYVLRQIENAEEKMAAAPDDAEVERLAKLDVLEFDRQVKEAAEKLRVTVGALRRAVTNRREQLAAEAAPRFLAPVEPWPEPVDGNALLGELCDILDLAGLRDPLRRRRPHSKAIRDMGSKGLCGDWAYASDAGGPLDLY